MILRDCNVISCGGVSRDGESEIATEVEVMKREILVLPSWTSRNSPQNTPHTSYLHKPKAHMSKGLSATPPLH